MLHTFMFTRASFVSLYCHLSVAKNPHRDRQSSRSRLQVPPKQHK